MCGRYASTRSAADLAALFDADDETDGEVVADYNVAPTDPVPIVRLTERKPGPVLCVARWGLVPAWSTDASRAARMINARAETVATSPAFARSFEHRRCVVPADGWYEWVRAPDGKRKQPYFMTRPEGLAFGGVWSMWTAGSSRLITFSVLTLLATGPLADVHARMPLVLPPERWAEWLAISDASGLLRPAPSEYLAGIELRPVSASVGDVRNDGPDLVRALPAPLIERSTVGRSADEANPTLF